MTPSLLTDRTCESQELDNEDCKSDHGPEQRSRPSDNDAVIMSDPSESSSMTADDTFSSSNTPTIHSDSAAVTVHGRPGRNDCIMGRGGGTNLHVGNIRFRKLVQKFKPDYNKASKTEKPNVARQVVQQWKAQTPPGRFLARLEDGTATLGWDFTKWLVVDDKKAREKASQCLRERYSGGDTASSVAAVDPGTVSDQQRKLEGSSSGGDSLQESSSSAGHESLKEPSAQSTTASNEYSAAFGSSSVGLSGELRSSLPVSVGSLPSIAIGSVPLGLPQPTLFPQYPPAIASDPILLQRHNHIVIKQLQLQAQQLAFRRQQLAQQQHAIMTGRLHHYHLTATPATAGITSNSEQRVLQQLQALQQQQQLLQQQYAHLCSMLPPATSPAVSPHSASPVPASVSKLNGGAAPATSTTSASASPVQTNQHPVDSIPLVRLGHSTNAPVSPTVQVAETLLASPSFPTSAMPTAFGYPDSSFPSDVKISRAMDKQTINSELRNMFEPPQPTMPSTKDADSSTQRAKSHAESVVQSQASLTAEPLLEAMDSLKSGEKASVALAAAASTAPRSPNVTASSERNDDDGLCHDAPYDDHDMANEENGDDNSLEEYRRQLEEYVMNINADTFGKSSFWDDCEEREQRKETLGEHLLRGVRRAFSGMSAMSCDSCLSIGRLSLLSNEDSDQDIGKTNLTRSGTSVASMMSDMTGSSQLGLPE